MCAVAEVVWIIARSLAIGFTASTLVFGTYCLYCHRNKSLGWHWDRRDR